MAQSENSGIKFFMPCQKCKRTCSFQSELGGICESCKPINCQRCNGCGTVMVAVENGAGNYIPCPECQPLGEFELDKTNQNVLAAKKIWESAAAKRKAEGDLGGALLRIGTRMSHLCMKYGSKPGVAPTPEDRERMLDLDESWHETTAALSRLKSKCEPFRTQAEIEAKDVEEHS